MKVTIRDIAEIAGVSVATVSRVINNKSKGVSEATRERIWKIVKEKNFQPSAIARGLVTKKSKIIGLLIPDITNPYYPELAKGVEDAASERGYNTILCDGGNSPDKELSHLDFLTEHYVSGIVYSNAIEISEETFSQLEKRSMTTVFVDSKTASGRAFNVHIDNKKAMVEVVNYLYENGHRHIGFMGGKIESYSTARRFDGYLEALHHLHMPYDPQLVVYGEYTIADARKATEELLGRNTKLTAIACCNDLMAIGAFEIFEEKGMQVPEDISVVGFDDIYMARHMKPRLTTMKQPAYEMGRASAETLINVIEGKGKELDRNIVFGSELKKRESVKKLVNFDRS